jgi:type VI secretion system protein VasG
MKNLKSLLGKLNDTSRKALEGAAGMCLSRTNYEVDIEHLLVKLLEATNSDVKKIVDHFGANASRLNREPRATPRSRRASRS